MATTEDKCEGIFEQLFDLTGAHGEPSIVAASKILKLAEEHRDIMNAFITNVKACMNEARYTDRYLILLIIFHYLVLSFDDVASCYHNFRGLYFSHDHPQQTT
jgi:hypothetical protein